MTRPTDVRSWVNARLEPGEEELAVGIMGVTSAIRRRRARAGARFVCVTSRRLFWTEHVLDAERDNHLRFDDVIAARKQIRDGHRWVLFVRHAPLERLAHVPSYHAWFIAGGNRSRLVRFDRTTLSASHRDTAAAMAVRSQLAARGISIERLPEARRPEGRDELTKATFLRRAE